MVGVDTNTSKWILLNSGPQLPLSILPDLCCFVCLLLPLSMRKNSALENAAFSPKKFSYMRIAKARVRAGQIQKNQKYGLKIVHNSCKWFRHSFVAMCSFLLFRMFQTILDCFVQTIKNSPCFYFPHEHLIYNPNCFRIKIQGFNVYFCSKMNNPT